MSQNDLALSRSAAPTMLTASSNAGSTMTSNATAAASNALTASIADDRSVSLTTPLKDGSAVKAKSDYDDEIADFVSGVIADVEANCVDAVDGKELFLWDFSVGFKPAFI